MKERSVFVSYCNKEHFCIHIESVHLSDGIYKLVLASESAPEGSFLNLTEWNQDPDKRPEEPKADSTQEGKPQCIDPIIFAIIFIICCTIFICTFTFSKVG